MKQGHGRWHGRAVMLALCPGSENVWVAYRHQLLKVFQEQFRMATITERVADDVIQPLMKTARQNVRCAQNIWTLLKIHHHCQKSSLRQVRKREESGRNDSELVFRDMFNKKTLHNLTIKIVGLLSMEFR